MSGSTLRTSRSPVQFRSRAAARIDLPPDRSHPPCPARTLLTLHAHASARYPALLESTAASERLGRFDILFAFPQFAITKGPRQKTPFLPVLDQHFITARARRAPGDDDDLPFTGGWLVFLGYELASEIEPTLVLPHSTDRFTAFALRIPAAAIYDHATHHLHLIAEADRPELLDGLHRDIECYAKAEPVMSLPLRGRVHEEDPVRFLAAVREARRHIAAGDVYQVNLSRDWWFTFESCLTAHGRSATGARQSPAAVYRALRTANPAPFAASLILGDWAILSSSPERLLTVRDGVISTRPIAGTRARTRDDGAERAALAAHPKERAEHIMLVDLERNDLGRICQAGTVQVDELMIVETYAHVHHIVSNVRGVLRDDLTPGNIIRAVFPGGTITGCPKARAMQIIGDLERSARGAYTGSIGYLNHDGSGDFNILIRTMTWHRTPARVHFRTGAGIVADSDPDAELAETRAKAEGLLRALAQNAYGQDELRGRAPSAAHQTR